MTDVLSEPGLRNVDTRPQLVRVAVGATALLAATATAMGFVGLLVESANEFSSVARFGGWQLYAAEAAIGFVIIVLGSVSAVWLLRCYRALRGRTPHRRVMLLVAILPGLFLGGAAVTPMRAALHWSSYRTAAAAAARQQMSEWQANYRKAPPVARAYSAPATGPSATALLTAADLGRSWYPAVTPTPGRRVVSAQMSRWGITEAARVTLTKQHWVGQMWHLDHMLNETSYVFSTPSAASRYVTGDRQRADAACQCNAVSGPDTVQRVAGTTVWEHTTSGTLGTQRVATFVVGSTAVTMLIDVHDADPSDAEFEALVAKALARATTR